MVQENGHRDTHLKFNHLFHNQDLSGATFLTFLSLGNSLKRMNLSENWKLKWASLQKEESADSEALTNASSYFMLSLKQRPQILCRP